MLDISGIGATPTCCKPDGKGNKRTGSIDMSSKQTEASDVLSTIERSGGWRLVMQGKTAGFDEATASVNDRTRLSSPQALLAIAFYLAKRGQSARSRMLVDGLARAVEAGEIPASDELWSEILLVDCHVRVYEDRAMGRDEENRLEEVIERLPPTDILGRALAMNHLCNINLHLGQMSRSQSYAENAMRAYLDGGAEYGALHLHVHLGQIRLARGDLTGAANEYTRMEERLSTLRDAPPGLIAVCQALRSEVAYEMNDVLGAQRRLDAAIASVDSEDAWIDVLAAAYRVSTRNRLCSGRSSRCSFRPRPCRAHGDRARNAAPETSDARRTHSRVDAQ